MKKIEEIIDFGNGKLHKVLELDLSKSPCVQDLGEDIFQVYYKISDTEDYTLDVGWYHGECPEGYFAVYLVDDKDHDWFNPLMREESKTYEKLLKDIVKALKFLQEKGVYKGQFYKSRK